PHSALRIPHLLAGVVVLALATPQASAQQPAQHADSTPKATTTLAPVVVTGVRLPTVRELVRGLAGRTASLDARDLDARGVRSLADALEQLPGVTTSDELGATAQMDVSLRGFQVSPVIGVPQDVTVYVDGVRANEPDAHEVNFDLLPLEDVERVEVVYGPSVLLGRNALGAAVNLVTRRGASPAARGIEASAGSWGRYELKARAGARHGVWDYYVGARYEGEGGWREDTRSRIGTLFAKLGLLTGTWDATLSYSGADNKIFQAGSLPESVAAVNPRRNFTGGDYFAPQAHLVILNAQRLLGHTQLAINAFGRSLSSEQFNANFVGEDSRQQNTTRMGGGVRLDPGAVRGLDRCVAERPAHLPATVPARRAHLERRGRTRAVRVREPWVPRARHRRAGVRRPTGRLPAAVRPRTRPRLEARCGHDVRAGMARPRAGSLRRQRRRVPHRRARRHLLHRLDRHRRLLPEHRRDA